MKNLQHSQTVINSWQQDYQSLHDILNSEQYALEHRNFDELTQIINDKNSLINTINSHQAPNLTNKSGKNATSLREFKAFCVAQPELQTSWNELMLLVEKCCQKNEVNARLIELLNQSSRRTFNLIKGFDPDNNIYNAKGDRTRVRYYSDSLSA